jgi:hypothetical protein
LILRAGDAPVAQCDSQGLPDAFQNFSFRTFVQEFPAIKRKFPDRRYIYPVNLRMGIARQIIAVPRQSRFGYETKGGIISDL